MPSGTVCCLAYAVCGRKPKANNGMVFSLVFHELKDAIWFAHFYSMRASSYLTMCIWQSLHLWYEYFKTKKPMDNFDLQWHHTADWCITDRAIQADCRVTASNKNVVLFWESSKLFSVFLWVLIPLMFQWVIFKWHFISLYLTGSNLFAWPTSIAGSQLGHHGDMVTHCFFSDGIVGLNKCIYTQSGSSLHKLWYSSYGIVMVLLMQPRNVLFISPVR